MAFGINILNDFNTLQIDGSNPNPSLVSKGVWYPAAGSGSSNTQAKLGWQSANISHNSGNAPKMVIRGNNCYAGIWSVQKSGNTWTWTLYTIHSEVNPAVEWFIFDKVSGLTRGSGFGLEISSASSELLMSDIYPTLKLHAMASDYTTQQGANGGNGAYPQNYDGSRKFGNMGIGPFWSSRIEERGDSLTGQVTFVRLNWIGALKWSGSTVDYIDHETAGTGKTYGWDDSSGQPSPMWIVDLTNV